jgi:hypothetical protein
MLAQNQYTETTACFQQRQPPVSAKDLLVPFLLGAVLLHGQQPA